MNSSTVQADAIETRRQAILVSSTEFLAAAKSTFVDQVERETILNFDQWLRGQGKKARTIFNKRQRLQSMLRWPASMRSKRHFLAALFGGGYGIKLDLR